MILRDTPRLVALQIDEVDPPAAIEIRAHGEEELDSEITRERFRLILRKVPRGRERSHL